MMMVLCTVGVASKYKALRSYLNAFNVIYTHLCAILLVISHSKLQHSENMDKNKKSQVTGLFSAMIQSLLRLLGIDTYVEFMLACSI